MSTKFGDHWLSSSWPNLTKCCYILRTNCTSMNKKYHSWTYIVQIWRSWGLELIIRVYQVCPPSLVTIGWVQVGQIWPNAGIYYTNSTTMSKKWHSWTYIAQIWRSWSLELIIRVYQVCPPSLVTIGSVQLGQIWPNVVIYYTNSTTMSKNWHSWTYIVQIWKILFIVVLFL